MGKREEIAAKILAKAKKVPQPVVFTVKPNYEKGAHAVTCKCLMCRPEKKAEE